MIAGFSEDLGSGLDFYRIGLLEVKKAADDGKLDAVLLKRLDCLGRDILKTQEFLKSLDQMGIRFYSPMEGELCYKNLFYGNEPMGVML